MSQQLWEIGVQAGINKLVSFYLKLIIGNQEEGKDFDDRPFIDDKNGRTTRKSRLNLISNRDRCNSDILPANALHNRPP
jgi:hypothetical protein